MSRPSRALGDVSKEFGTNDSSLAHEVPGAVRTLEAQRIPSTCAPSFSLTFISNGFGEFWSSWRDCVCQLEWLKWLL
jgi:hypothetical protein